MSHCIMSCKVEGYIFAYFVSLKSEKSKVQVMFVSFLCSLQKEMYTKSSRKSNYYLLGLYTNTSNGCIIEIHESVLYILVGSVHFQNLKSPLSLSLCEISPE